MIAWIRTGKKTMSSPQYLKLRQAAVDAAIELDNLRTGDLGSFMNEDEHAKVIRITARIWEALDNLVDINLELDDPIEPS